MFRLGFHDFAFFLLFLNKFDTQDLLYYEFMIADTEEKGLVKPGKVGIHGQLKKTEANNTLAKLSSLEWYGL